MVAGALCLFMGNGRITFQSVAEFSILLIDEHGSLSFMLIKYCREVF